MAVTKKFVVSSSKIGSTVINGIVRSSDNLNTEIINDPTTGSLDPKYTGIRQVKPTAEIVTKAIETALGACGIGGVDMSSSVVVQYLQKLLDGGGRASSGHLSRTFNAGLMVLGNLSVSQGQDAELTLRIHAGFDGTNDPIAYAESVTLPTDTDVERFTLGPCTVESVAMTGVTALEVDFGIEVVQEGADGDVYPTIVYMNTRSPTITITCMDASLAGSSDFPIGGLAATHANTDCFLRKLTKGGTVEANASEEHIKITAAGTAHVLQSNDGSGMLQVKVECHHDGTNTPVVITTSQAIA